MAADDTIFALSSGRPPAAIAVVRISGPAALATARSLAGGLPRPRSAGLRRLRAREGITLDRALVLVFPGPESATGEDLVELHLHGGRAVVAAVETALQGAGSRRAMAGEFTRRALMNGRIDLAEAEGLADLLAAETETQRRAALTGAEGVVSRSVGGWLDRIVALSARVEAQIDYSDEGDVSADALPAIAAEAAAIGAEMRAVLAQPTVDRLRDGYRVVLAGPPNAGKSTLLNLLAERDAAIVSPTAGTTRDRIEAPVTRDGVPYVLIDTAGLVTDSDDAIEAIGVSLAERAAREADLVLWLGDDPPGKRRADLLVYPRCDELERQVAPADRIAVSRGDSTSVTRLWEAIGERIAAMLPATDRVLFNARQHRLCLIAVRALEGAARVPDWLLVAEELRIARTELATVLGRNATEAVLDDIFQRFCIGK